MTGVAIFELSRFVKYSTRFLHDIFACFVCTIYVVRAVNYPLMKNSVFPGVVSGNRINVLHSCNVQCQCVVRVCSRLSHCLQRIFHLYGFIHSYVNAMAAFVYFKFLSTFVVRQVDGVQGVSKRMMSADGSKNPGEHHSVAGAIFALLLTLILLVVALKLHGMLQSRLFTRRLNILLVDYALAVSALLCICISYFPGKVVHVDRISDLDHINGYNVTPTLKYLNGEHRSFGVQLSSFGGEAAAGAVAALPIVTFFYFDQNFSSLLCQLESMHLKKGSYFHSSFLCMAVFNIVGPFCGLPFVTGSLPHSPQMVKALTTVREGATAPDRLPSVSENRVAPFLIYLFIGTALITPFGRAVIMTIPEAVVDGILIFVGVAGIFDTQLWERVQLMFMEFDNFPKESKYTQVAPKRMHMFTVIQVTSLAVAWSLNGLAMVVPSLAPLGLCFPIVIVLLVPLRETLIPRIFTPEELAYLDSH
eukprot:gene2748-3527_t